MIRNKQMLSPPNVSLELLLCTRVIMIWIKSDTIYTVPVFIVYLSAWHILNSEFSFGVLISNLQYVKPNRYSQMMRSFLHL